MIALIAVALIILVGLPFLLIGLALRLVRMRPKPRR